MSKIDLSAHDFGRCDEESPLPPLTEWREGHPLAPRSAAPPWSWTPPAEPGPEVRRLRPVERYAGDNSIWYDREPDNSGWRCVMRGRPGGVIEWLQVVAGAGSVYGGRQLIDASAELEPSVLDEWPQELLKARIKFWVCPDGHSDRKPGDPLRQTVEWIGDVAHCLEPGCGKTSAEVPAP